MQKTILTKVPENIPLDIYRFISGAKIYDSSSSPEARVYFIDKDNGYYLKYLKNPERLCDTIACELRKLHETDYTDCPVMDKTINYLATAEKNYHTGNYDQSQFPSFGYSSAKEAYDILMSGKNALRDKVLLHGDYCLPNRFFDAYGRDKVDESVLEVIAAAEVFE